MMFSQYLNNVNEYIMRTKSVFYPCPFERKHVLSHEILSDNKAEWQHTDKPVSIDQNYVFQPNEWHRIRNLDIDNISWVQHEVPSRYRDVVRCYCNIRLGRWGGKSYVTFRKTRNEVSNNLYDDMGVATAFTKLFLILYSVYK